MGGPAIHQRCWNHETREAVCRCPSCGRSFCRECVTEHEARLLCAACIARAARGPAQRRGGRLLPAAMLLAGLLFSWAIFFGLGESAAEFRLRLEQGEWQNR